VTISHPPGGRLAVLSAKPVITFPAAEHQRPLAGIKLYCLVTEAHKCEQLAQGCFSVFAPPPSRIWTHDLLIASPALYPLHICTTNFPRVLLIILVRKHGEHLVFKKPASQLKVCFRQTRTKLECSEKLICTKTDSVLAVAVVHTQNVHQQSKIVQLWVPQYNGISQTWSEFTGTATSAACAQHLWSTCSEWPTWQLRRPLSISDQLRPIRTARPADTLTSKTTNYIGHTMFAGWLTELRSNPTQTKSFRRRSSQPISWLSTEKRKQTQQSKHASVTKYTTTWKQKN